MKYTKYLSNVSVPMIGLTHEALKIFELLGKALTNERFFGNTNQFILGTLISKKLIRAIG